MLLIRFLIVGIANTLVGLTSIYLAMYFLKFDIMQANAFGYSIGILVSFTLNKSWTFSNKDRITPSFLRYLLVLFIAYVANLFTVIFSNTNFNLDPYLAQATGIIPYLAIGFMGSRYFAFGRKNTISIPNQKSNNHIQNKKPIISRAIDISIAVPCYNEEEVLPETTRQLSILLQQLISEKKSLPIVKSIILMMEAKTKRGI